MDFLKITYDILEQTLKLDDSDIGHEYTEIQFNVFSKDDIERDISNIEFKLKLTKDGTEIYSVRYPIDPIKYELMKTTTIGTSMQLLGANYSYRVEAYVGTISDSKEITSLVADVTTSKGPQPFPSWTFDNSKHAWVAPSPNPYHFEGVDNPDRPTTLCQWSEKRQQWVEGIPEEVIVQDGGKLNN
jgi:hypothetical protein